MIAAGKVSQSIPEALFKRNGLRIVTKHVLPCLGNATRQNAPESGYLDFCTAGNNSPMRIAMMAMTTSPGGRLCRKRPVFR